MSASDTPTPRTDEAENDCALEDKNHPHTNWVPSMLARQLERELAATERENQRLRAIFPKICEAIGNGSFCTGHGNSIEFLEDIPKEVRLSQQATERLAERFQWIIDAKADSPERLVQKMKTMAREALSAWSRKEND